MLKAVLQPKPRYRHKEAYMKTFIAQPLITEKSLAKTADGAYQFVVPTWANKRQIAQHIAAHFGVTVVNVNTSTMRGEAVRFRNKSGVRSTYKKATVQLKKGESIESFSMPVEASQPAPTEAAPKAKAVKEVKTESKITVRSKSKGKKADAGEDK